MTTRKELENYLTQKGWSVFEKDDVATILIKEGEYQEIDITDEVLGIAVTPTISFEAKLKELEFFDGNLSGNAKVELYL
jgi:hypothetical protein